jgi:hypothetical protein
MRLWSTKAVEVWLLSTLPPTGSALQRLLERWTYQTPRRLFDDSTPGAPTGSNERQCIRTHPCHGATAGAPALSGRDRPPRQRCPRRQSPMESGTLGPSAAARNPGDRRDRLGHPDRGALLGNRRTPNNPQRQALRALGGGGNRTRVLERPDGSSTGVAGGQISPRGSHRRRTPRLSRLRCPAVAARRSHRRQPAHDARSTGAGVPRRTAA